MEKKKILHIVEAFAGGIYTYLLELSDKLSEEYEIVIAYAERKQTPQNFREQFNKNIKFIEVKNFTRSINPVKDIKACIEINKIVKEEKPDIIHMHSSKAGIIGRVVVRPKYRKMFYTPHGYSFLKQDDSKLKRFMYKTIEKMAVIINKKCKIIACSEGEYKESLSLTKNATYINNGVNIKEIDKIVSSKHKIDFNKIKICTVGRIGFQKNPKLFNEIAENFPDIEFTWIGDGELSDELKSSNIHITGWKTREEVSKTLSENDIFLLPSLWEGLPIALLEAMYLGKICIVSNVIGNRDVIKNGENGFVCNELEEYCASIQKIITKQVNSETIINNTKNDIIDNYNIQNLVTKYKELYIL